MPFRRLLTAALSAAVLGACTDRSVPGDSLAPLAPMTPSAIVAADACASNLVPIADCEALVALYNGTDGPNWIDNTNWGTDPNPCTWHGVTCLHGGDTHGPVVLLNLSSNGLAGPIPPELGDISELLSLLLFDNALTGPIPSELGGLTSLTALWLNGNQLTGSIPASLANLDELLLLQLSGNGLTGAIPAALGELDALQSLDLSGNLLSGSIPAGLGNLSGLAFLALRNNDLTGSIPPVLGSLTGLELLALNGNQLTGPIPAELGNLTNLVNLFLNENQLGGQVPLEVAVLGDPMQACSIRDNEGLFIPDLQAYRDADADGDGFICQLRITTAEDVGESLEDGVAELVPGSLNPGQANALTTKIEHALEKADAGRYHVAINLMEAFIGQLEDMIANGTLSAAEAAPFLDQAELLIQMWTELL